MNIYWDIVCNMYYTQNSISTHNSVTLYPNSKYAIEKNIFNFDESILCWIPVTNVTDFLKENPQDSRQIFSKPLRVHRVQNFPYSRMFLEQNHLERSFEHLFKQENVLVPTVSHLNNNISPCEKRGFNHRIPSIVSNWIGSTQEWQFAWKALQGNYFFWKVC